MVCSLLNEWYSYERRKWEPIELKAVNDYARTLNTYSLADLLSRAYSSILDEYCRRVPPDQGQLFILQQRVHESHQQEEQSGCADSGTLPHNGQGKAKHKIVKPWLIRL